MSPDSGGGFQALEPEGFPAPEAEPRAERPNFLTATRFVDFDLPPEIMAGVDQAGFEYCTPIQAQAIPVALKGLDIAGQAQTGTGKTTAFLVPLMHRLLKNKPLEPAVPRAIIVTPTRELALQIHKDLLVLAGATSLRQALVIGGVEYREQAELLGTAPEIVICTPGRIIDYLRQGVFKTRGVEAAVVDEADRLLDMGFIKDLKYLLGSLPPFSHRQTMLFSATLDERVLELTYEFMNPPQFIMAEPDKASKLQIEQELYHVGRGEKLSLLMGLLRREDHRRVMVFSNTKSGVDWLAKKLAGNGFQAEGITGDLPQPKRLRLMEAFKENRLQILVATDVASRGIHVEDVSHVYNYDLPQDAENYIHRIGRTARAGREGKAVSFGCEDYVFHLEAIENLLGEKIPVFWADNGWFQTDLGGEVSVKERKSRPAARPERAERAERGQRGAGRPAARSSPRSSPRSSSRSRRPGGIFGLAPLLLGDSGEDLRRRLSWEEGPEEAAPEEAALEEAALENGVPEEAALEDGGREGRRRRRRRGRRGRAEQPVAEQPVAEQPSAEELQAEQPSAEQPVAEQLQDEQPMEEPQAEQPQAEQPLPEQPQAEQPQAEKPEKAKAKPRRARQPKTVEARAPETEEPPPAKGRRKKAAAEPAEGEEVKSRKKTEPKAPKKTKPPQAEEPGAAPKRPRRPAVRKTKAPADDLPAGDSAGPGLEK